MVINNRPFCYTSSVSLSLPVSVVKCFQYSSRDPSEEHCQSNIAFQRKRIADKQMKCKNKPCQRPRVINEKCTEVVPLTVLCLPFLTRPHLLLCHLCHLSDQQNQLVKLQAVTVSTKEAPGPGPDALLVSRAQFGHCQHWAGTWQVSRGDGPAVPRTSPPSSGRPSPPCPGSTTRLWLRQEAQRSACTTALPLGLMACVLWDIACPSCLRKEEGNGTAQHV